MTCDMQISAQFACENARQHKPATANFKSDANYNLFKSQIRNSFETWYIFF